MKSITMERNDMNHFIDYDDNTNNDNKMSMQAITINNNVIPPLWVLLCAHSGRWLALFESRGEWVQNGVLRLNWGWVLQYIN